MEDLSKLEQAWQELQEVPAYVERFEGVAVCLTVVQHCSECGHWHNADDECPVLVEV